MVSQIFYFSGTGNCLAVARKFNEKSSIKSEIIPISGLNEKQVIKSDRVGFIFPVYCHKVPDIVKNFIMSMEFISTPYIFAIVTHAGEPGQSLYDIKKLLAKKKKSLSFGIAIDMPGNAVELNPEIELVQLSTMEAKVIKIVELIEAQKNNVIYGKNSLFEHIRNQIIGFLARIYVFSPKRYKVSANCTGCGICEKVCPVNNISLYNQKPKWGKNCVFCLACFHWCPNEAIYDNRYIKNRRRYHHPDITIKEMFLRKDGH